MKHPIHANSGNANQTLFWSGSDQLELWQSNMKKTPQFFKDNGWDTEDAIEYQYNSHGFRCPEFTDEPCYIVLGCSFVEGVGLQSHQTIPHILSNLLNSPVMNLGVGGSSNDTSFRLLDHYINKLNVRGVFLLTTFTDRCELILDDVPVVYTPMTAPHQRDHIYLRWLMSEANQENNRTKNLYAMRHLCSVNDIKIVEYDVTDTIFTNIIGRARDMSHPCGKTMNACANKFYEMWNT